MTTGYIYVIENIVRDLGGFKVGITTKPSRRFKELSIGLKALVVGLWETTDYKLIERSLHTQYTDARVPQSEWFALTTKELADVIKYLNSIANNLQLMHDFQPLHPIVVPTTTRVNYQAPLPDWLHSC
jgi:hypothetical protein